MRIDKQALAGAIGQAVDEAREDPSLDAADIVNSVFARTVEGAESDEPDPKVKKAAHDRLHAAAEMQAALGENDSAPMVNALIGIGLALLSNGEEAAYRD